MTVFIHIGLNKTGSSSVQKFCHENRQSLAAHGLIYPHAGIHDAAHYGVSKMLMNKPAARNVVMAEGLEDIILSAVGCKQDVLVSSEYFFTATHDQVIALPISFRAACHCWCWTA